MQELIIQIMNDFGYLGVASLIMIENLFPPIPSEVILTFGGFMTTYSQLGLWGMVIAATIGSTVGAVILYFVGRLLSIERLESLISGRLGKLLRLQPADLHKAQAWFVKRGKLTVFFCRFVPLIRSLISIPAGTMKMRFDVFLLLSAAGTFIWNIVLVSLGRSVGDAWPIIAGLLDTYSSLTVFVLGLAAAIGLMIFVKKRFLFQGKKSKN